MEHTVSGSGLNDSLLEKRTIFSIDTFMLFSTTIRREKFLIRRFHFGFGLSEALSHDPTGVLARYQALAVSVVNDLILYNSRWGWWIKGKPSLKVLRASISKTS